MNINHLWRCPSCGVTFGRLLPHDLEPMFTLAQACDLLNIKESTMRTWLHHNPIIPKRYIQDNHHRRHRMLYASEIKYLRDGCLKVYKGRKLTKQRDLLSPKEFRESYPTLDYQVDKASHYAVGQDTATDPSSASDPSWAEGPDPLRTDGQDAAATD